MEWNIKISDCVTVTVRPRLADVFDGDTLAVKYRSTNGTVNFSLPKGQKGTTMTILTERIGLTTKEWMFMKNPIPVAIISVIYLYIVLKLGPRYMKNRKPYDLTKFIQCYNVFQIVANALFVYNIIDMGLHKIYFFNCKEPTYDEGMLSERSDKLECYILYLKVIDYIETIVFVLRKKQRQISFLHVYHHITTVLIGWFMVKYYIAGLFIAFAMINCTVHVIMYSYYFLSTCGPSVQRVLNPIKPLITVIQMVQFAILGMYTLQFTFLSCPQPAVLSTVLIINITMNAILFYNFYTQNYSKQAKQK